MHRFRKKSDVNRTQPAPSPSREPEALHDVLPPVDDFRTSLILPDLSRRFSLLRTSAGEPVTVDDLRTKFAQHRAQGSQHTISEEEEDMLLETLNRLRGKHTPERSQEHINGADSVVGEDESGSNSSNTIKGKGASSIASSASSTRSPSKRYSNNLFGSGRLRDYTYLRNASRISSNGSTKTQSFAPSEASSSAPTGNTSSIADSLRPSTPTGTVTSVDDSVQSSPSPSNVNEQSSSTPPTLDQPQPLSAAEYRLQKQLSPAVLKRASVALESVIKEIEDDVDEEIVMPRSTPIMRNHGDHQHQVTPHQFQRQLSEASTRDNVSSIVVEAGMAISSDKPIDASEMQQRGPSPVPLNATPGYIPGMPRPMTPRDFEFFADEQRSHSTTPRATSPNVSQHSSFSLGESATASVGISKMLRRENSTSSTVNRQSPRPTTPLFLQRPAYGGANSSGSMNGRHTPVDDRSRLHDWNNGGFHGEHGSFDQEQPLSALLGRRRPASPLASSPFQPMSSAGYSISRPTTPSKISRPTTPSKIIWKVPTDDNSPNQFGTASPSGDQGHSRDNSWTSDSGLSDAEVQRFIAAAHAGGGSDVFGSISPSVGKEAIRGANGIRPPVLQSSDSYSSLEDNSRSWASNRVNSQGRSSSPLNESVISRSSSRDISTSPDNNGSQYRNYRSVTPTQNAPKSAASPTLGSFNTSPRAVKRSSRQSPPTSTSPFDLAPIPSLNMNPRANLSNSSLESAGSSFHSWDDNNDKVLNIFDEIDAKPAWYDISTPSSGKSTSASETRNITRSSNGTSPDDDDWEADDIVMGYAGLRKGDFTAIQQKLVAVARTFEHRGSALRKRRPSTSQSNYSARDLRVASPPPSSPSTHRSMAREQQQGNGTADHATVVAPVLAPSLSASSSDSGTGVRRNLTQVLFGDKEDETPEPTPAPAPRSTSPPANASLPSDVVAESSISELLQSAMGHTHDTRAQSGPPESPSKYFLHRNPSTHRIPQSPQDQAALALEVQQKVQAATAALRKPSNEKLSTVPRKRIDPSKISQPTLVSASTSVDAIPLRSPSVTAGSSSGTSKIGSRFRKLRGSIRGKTSTTVDESASITSDKNPSPGSQTATYDAEKLRGMSGPQSSGFVDSNRQKTTLPTPPASAGPGLKGFMARFRGKRASEAPQSSSSSTLDFPQLISAPLSASSKQFPLTPTPTSGAFSPSLHHTHLEPDLQSSSRLEQVAQPTSPLSQQQHLVPDPGQGNGTIETDALQQLFAAANKIGIDQSALNDLLVRSGSISSRNLLSRSGSTSHSGSGQGNSQPNVTSGDLYLAAPSLQQPTLSVSSGSDHTATPVALAFTASQASTSNHGDEGTDTEDAGRRESIKGQEHFRRRKSTDAAANAVVRRTIIFVDPRQPTPDPGVTRKASTKRRRTSVQSASNRSIHDRVPTPPPSKTPLGKRFSHDASPPVPHLPQAYGGQAGNQLAIPSGPADGPRADSVYELYGDSRVASVMSDPNNHDNRGGEQTGVELIELANGETIWKIVNGLRDDDDESVYSLGRNSISSEYSTREGGEGMQVFVKEHVRAGSKGSQVSMMSRKKESGGKPRPETKIMYSTPEHVARLIEQISHGMDAGSFNFRPYRDSGSASGSGIRSSEPGHSASSSLSANEITWTMKEIDHMLTAMSPRSS